MEENKSEIARLMQRIQDEYKSASRALYSPAIVAKHEFITKRMEGIEEAHEELQTIVGQEEAIKLVVEKISSIEETMKSQIDPAKES